MTWSYGLVEMDKKLVLCEIYRLKQGNSICPLNFEDIYPQDIEMIVGDIRDQLKYGYYMVWEKGDLKRK